jgi:hypothetical protein
MIDSIRRREHLDDTPDSSPPSTRPATPLARQALLRELDVDRAPEAPEMLAFINRVRAQAVSASGPLTNAQVVQSRIDSLRDDYSGPYVVDGQSVRAPVMFRMSISNEAEVKANAGELAKIVGTNAWLILSGQAPAKLVVAVTQKLIDRGHLPPPPPGDVATRIRMMQWRFGIGADCASYTRQAFERATGKTMQQVGLPLFTGFRTLDKNPNFKRVAVTDVRPGDIITCDPYGRETIGHNLIVRDHTLVSDPQRAALAQRYGVGARDFFNGPGPFHAIEVDSSWGAGDGDTTIGGQRRETWFYDEGSKRWGRIGPGTPPQCTWSTDRPLPLDILHGAYRVMGT